MIFARRHLAVLFSLAASFTLKAACAQTAAGFVQVPATTAVEPSGIEFQCAPSQLPRLKRDMGSYLKDLHIPSRLFSVHEDVARGELRFTLTTPEDDTSTLDFVQRKEFDLRPYVVELPNGGGTTRKVTTVSPKEIVLAMMQHGRTTTFSGAACSLAAVVDHVGIRQNIVAWAEELEWDWPDGGPAHWNSRYWLRGTPKPKVALRTAFNDAFFHQDNYGIGCYTSAKLVITQGILDYFYRIKRDVVRAKLVEARLLADGDPLVNIEPAAMWSFESDYDPATANQPGKLVRISSNVAANNFVPGDWFYLRNTDATTAQKTGYEGSNPIYLGRNLLADYFNDHSHAYPYTAKLDQVYQWRHGVFSLSRDKDKAEALSADDYRILGRSPEAGGLLLPFRVVPYYFGFEVLPPVVRKPREVNTP